ncbi:MAG: KilA-N domain-containing protein [Candidatus Humimicrobiaceae bacterium]
MAKDKTFKTTIIVDGSEITVTSTGEANKDYISLTDMTKNFEGGSSLIEQWLRNKDTILFMGTWEKLYNADFNSLEFEGIKNEAGASSYYLSVKKWVLTTNAKGIKSTAGRYGGTFAHKDIAFEFGSWLSPEFKLYLIIEYQRLKEDENSKLSLEWNINRMLSKLNYKIHTDAIKANLISNELTPAQIVITYANEADLLNVALFGKTAKTWRDENPDLKGNIRDYATIEQLIVVVNLENMNANLIEKGLSQQERLIELNNIARNQLKAFLNNSTVKKIENLNPSNSTSLKKISQELRGGVIDDQK